jgi:hypothetical protein
MTWIIAGAIVMVASELATLAGVEPFATWNTPIAWTGFIVFADAVVFRARGRSLIRSAPGEFAVVAFVSVPLWIVFEGYNLVIRNWYYTGLVENFWLRQFGFAWAFATIWPAIFEGAELIGVLRGTSPWRDPRLQAGQDGERDHETVATAGIEPRSGIASPGSSSYRASVITVGIGGIMLAVPFAVSSEVARYLAAPVWLGFIFLLDPINRRFGGPALGSELRQGDAHRLVNLAFSGLLCGVLWEFWNYWAHSKWHYTVPIMENLKIFEMPVPGYLGFPAFAFECFTMYVFIRRLIFPKLDWTIAL